ncbi:MAG: YkuJ family protein [Lactobacillaceae bacterium]|jgi:uncharacterized protein YkuJ|nr:YkuJ family protein [Lactobacillaceae bacterium]
MKENKLQNNQSELIHIIRRLQIMSDSNDDISTRSFDLFGIEQIEVTYDRRKKLYSIAYYNENIVFSFDDLDLAAIEIFQILNDIKDNF